MLRGLGLLVGLGGGGEGGGVRVRGCEGCDRVGVGRVGERVWEGWVRGRVRMCFREWVGKMC